ncbi:hypothetical protein, partial [Klebsiella pneumoniae]|uniref:hypothetical protein n=1 Tax=Klebsiella pneumoniae TaxID=573 RepID=UPI001C81E820
RCNRRIAPPSAANKENLFHILLKRKTPATIWTTPAGDIPPSPFQPSAKETIANSIPLAYMENKFHNTIETEQTFP